MFFSARMQTNISLRNIQLSEYADGVTTLQSQVNAYLADDDEGDLPANLCINGIATAIHMNASARVRNVGFAPPRVRRVAGDWDSSSFPPVPDAELPLCAVQGYSPRAFRVEQGQDRFSHTYVRSGPAGRGGRGFDRDKAGHGRCDLNVMDDIPLRGIGPSTRISTVVLLYQMCNAMHVSGLGTRPPAVICW